MWRKQTNTSPPIFQVSTYLTLMAMCLDGRFVYCCSGRAAASRRRALFAHVQGWSDKEEDFRKGGANWHQDTHVYRWRCDTATKQNFIRQWHTCLPVLFLVTRIRWTRKGESRCCCCCRRQASQEIQGVVSDAFPTDMQLPTWKHAIASSRGRGTLPSRGDWEQGDDGRRTGRCLPEDDANRPVIQSVLWRLVSRGVET